MTVHKLLVANRGEIAERIIRSARALDIATVAVHSDPDADALFVEAADEAVRLPGAAPSETYLRADRIIEAARLTGADAIHPGYGFLSENAEFARACADAGITFVGPPVEAIEAMGSKIAAKELMEKAGVPVLPGATIDDAEEIDSAAVSALADGIGYPLLVKAAFGGGGRGMRIVRSAADVLDAVTGARREAASAFGNGTVFLERFVEDPRHVEVQIFGDTHGTVVHLFERECSIQRRYQKIVEEAPSPAVDEALRTRLGDAAVAAGAAIGYTGAGTVEFVMAQTGEFFFLEVNTRLQVEHPVTEEITGLDLVALQIAVAEGEPLPAEVTGATITGHAIEARLYAEDPSQDYLPGSGTVHRFSVPALPGVRVDTGVRDGSVIGTHYDPMLAKVIAHGRTRAEAARKLARALAEAEIHGPVTNRDLLVAILREPEFLAGRTDTGYLTRHEPAVLIGPPAESTLAVHALAAALADQSGRRDGARVQRPVPTGWRNVRSASQHAEYRIGDTDLDVSYRLGRGTLEAGVNGTALAEPAVLGAGPERVDLRVGGVRRAVRVHRVGDTVYVDSVLGASTLTERPRLPEPGTDAAPGSLLAPMPGTVVRVAAEAGQQVEQGTVIVVFEAMKMEHSVRAPVAGTVARLSVQVGDTVESGEILAVIEEVEA
ncbi:MULTISPECIES: ATP-binding protein [Pseudonocardia]|uniref:Biotin-dependent 3-methylcrotonyl-coenzyme A carboxylase alpha1 subunit n=2 Tax=Pseudonocardia TaxID=1847 RepID=A0A1Y2N6D1_PSEAH|nr:MULTISPECIES: biotin carboxylase N-terminal domain-containing protein [Pseudonocardia]OSY42721.1 Acetyl-/propionyl-coenzyme A carboxylase alpha chain [Pseudonocardia autotrophica]TDN77298.1 acetyl/propionyl-CoA carboxylase alpha subunit [Pseudonocardia autotrophica]BBG01319.1 acetyl/propionyl-CoA carboxylase subunit alpha [Pseudonocardia autotrophica]GEC24375.1 acetyl/propionyl-CoA carboxylase subuit alpha [Pseudonocardia saturnea]